MTKWQYMTVDLDAMNALSSSELDRYGQLGWELAGYSCYGSIEHRHYIFKRPSQDEEPALSPTQYLSVERRWPKAGDKMRFLNENGYDHEREDAAKVFNTTDIYTVRDFELGGWSSKIYFEGIPSGFNSVMFEFAE